MFSWVALESAPAIAAALSGVADIAVSSGWGGIPTVATDYSPSWDVNPAVWTRKAIELGYRSRMTEEFAILGIVEKGWITGLDGKKFGSVGLVVNCPIVYRFL